jgi:N-acetylglucosamine malate deacetylase 2
MWGTVQSLIAVSRYSPSALNSVRVGDLSHTSLAASEYDVADLNQLLGRTMVLVAHPDDEAVGCGGLLQRVAEPVVVFCTDGAPRDEFFWRKYGARLRYARHREDEARRAMAIAGVNEMIFLAANPPSRVGASGQASGELGANRLDDELFVDQELCRAIPEAVSVLSTLIQRYRPEALLTMAYEGGHPDHDTCSFITPVLARDHGLPAWEFPLYHRDEREKGVFQQFIPRQGRSVDDSGIELKLTASEVECKREMLAAYESQGAFLAEFSAPTERFRRQATYDYSRPPHAGRLNYEVWGWPISGSDVVRAFEDFMRARRRQIV